MKHVTKFQDKVCRIIKRIPKGHVMTYRQVAKAIGNPKAVRAVGNALNKNRDPKIPCHRVIRANGKIGGYRDGAKKKRELLIKEGVLL